MHCPQRNKLPLLQVCSWCLQETLANVPSLMARLPDSVGTMIFSIMRMAALPLLPSEHTGSQVRIGGPGLFAAHTASLEGTTDPGAEPPKVVVHPRNRGTDSLAFALAKWGCQSCAHPRVWS
jgi:hypothetical protein